MEVQRTVPVELDVDSDDAALLRETVDEFLWTANYVVDHAWQGEYNSTSRAQLQTETCDEVRDQTRLHANLVQNARNEAVDAVQGVVARRKQGTPANHTSRSRPSSTTIGVPRSTRSPCRWQLWMGVSKSSTSCPSRSETHPTAGISTPRDEVPLATGQAGDTDDYEVTGAELHRRDGEWVLHLRTKAEVESDTPEQAATGQSTVLGVTQLAVTSRGVFWSGHEFDHWRREYEKRCESLQQYGSRPPTRPSGQSDGKRQDASR